MLMLSKSQAQVIAPIGRDSIMSSIAAVREWFAHFLRCRIACTGAATLRVAI
jgi:hypothetical protein